MKRILIAFLGAILVSIALNQVPPAIYAIHIAHGQSIEEKTEIPAILQRIAFCESGNKHYASNGSVLRGKNNPLDTGLFQINARFHGKESQRLGMDILTKKGNIAYALYLYKMQVTKPWNWSKKCWSKK